MLVVNQKDLESLKQIKKEVCYYYKNKVHFEHTNKLINRDVLIIMNECQSNMDFCNLYCLKKNFLY